MLAKLARTILKTTLGEQARTLVLKIFTKFSSYCATRFLMFFPILPRSLTPYRSTLDRHTILKTTLVELARTLDLENCTIWMPSCNGRMLELTHELERRLMNVPTLVPVTDPTVLEVFNTRGAITVPANSTIGIASSRKGAQGASWQVGLVWLTRVSVWVTMCIGAWTRFLLFSFGVLVTVL
jgi:hypothetical protein